MSDDMSNRVQQDLENDVAVVEEFNVVAAVEVMDYGDTGSGFILEVDGGRVLFVIGQEFYAYAHTPEPDPELLCENQSTSFPHNRIEYTYGPESGLRLSIKGIGTYLEPRSRVDWQEPGPSSDIYDGLIPDKFYGCSLNEFLTRFGFRELPLRSDVSSVGVN